MFNIHNCLNHLASMTSMFKGNRQASESDGVAATFDGALRNALCLLE
jgi:hypothetical protein